MRRLLLLLACVAALGAAVGATVSAFSDEAVNSGNSLTAAPTFCPRTATVSATADSWVDQAAGQTGTNHGSDAQLWVRSRNSNRNRRTFVRFTLPNRPAGCTTVTSARLRLNASSAAVPRTLQADAVTANWTENGITWSNQPGVYGAATTAPSAAGWVEWNVTALVAGMYSVGTTYGFRVRDASEGSATQRDQIYAAREAASNTPELVVTLGP